jgi:hypothetical protein
VGVLRKKRGCGEGRMGIIIIHKEKIGGIWEKKI